MSNKDFFEFKEKEQDINLLIEYVKKDDALSIKNWMSKNGGKLIKDDHGNSLLHYACMFNKTECVNFLTSVINIVESDSAPIGFLYQHYKIGNVDKQTLMNVRENVKRFNCEDKVGALVLECVKYNEYALADFVLKILDLSSYKILNYYNEKSDKICHHSFVEIAYFFDDFDFYNLLINNGYILSKSEANMMYKVADIDNKKSWFDIFKNNKIYDIFSPEVINFTNLLFC